MQLTDRDYGILQLGIDSLTQRIAELNLTLIIEQDFTKLGAFLGERGSFVNPSYDPAMSKLSRRDFWLHLLDEEGRSVACSAERIVETSDFAELIATGKIWYAQGFPAIGGPARIDVIRPSRPVRGIVSHSGSTWVDPSWRGQGLAMLLTYLSRAISFRNYGAEVNTGFVRHSLYVTSVPTQSYGYAHVELCFDGWFPPQGTEEVLYLCWIDAAEFVAQIEALPFHPKNPVPLLDPVEAPA